jgi:Superfamily II DNA/RNA helicases, SNF2 family
MVYNLNDQPSFKDFIIMSSSFVSGFVSNFVEKAVQNILKIDTRFNALVDRAGFGFKKHQLDGVMFCVQNEKKTAVSLSPLSAPLRGGIVADEMGLGKTLLMIGTMFANFLPKTIIVVPPILIQQWAKEIYRCSGHNALIYHGANKKRVTFDELTSKKTCIVLTTYNTLIPLKSKALNKGASSDLLRVQWDRVIFDEAHHLRNFRTARFQWCKQISAPIRWLITGTPIQNRRADFYSLCFMLGFDKAFFKVFNDPIAYIKENYILRRTKAQVGIDLPPVNRTNIVVPWKNVGEKMLSEEMHSLITKQSGVSCDKGGYAADMILRNIHDPRALLLIAMMRSKQSCILPLLMKKSIDSCILEDKTGVYLDAVSSSSKLDAVIKTILERKDNGKGKIVFCHFIDEIDTIARRLREGGVEKVVLYDGRTKSNKKRVFDKADVIILQIQTGCEGLNLQEFFSEIYFVSPHWNPAIEDQAIARCHRIGQLLDVEVFKFEMSGFGLNADTLLESATLDKYVNQVQTVKRDIAVSVI